jgi:carboxymethylenebutenolidase
MAETIIAQDVALVTGYMARPIKEGKYPGIVVIQEWWGLDEHIRDVVRRFARQGYVAIAPDLFHGKLTNEPSEAQKLSMGLDRARAVRDVQAVVDYIRGLESSNGAVATIGYCMGGGISLLTACNANVNAAIVYYGGLPNPVDQLDRVNAPVLAIYGSDETERANQVESEMKKRGKTVEKHIYEGARHSFFNDSWEERYHAQASADAWETTLSFLKEHVPA